MTSETTADLFIVRERTLRLSDRLELDSIWFVFRKGYTDPAPESKRLPNRKIIEYETAV